MKNNTALQTDILYALKWEPLLHGSEIKVVAKDGVVSLTGEVDSYIKKTEAVNATKKVIGVTSLVQKIEVKVSGTYIKTDLEIANAIYTSLNKTWSLPKDEITIKVENGWVTISGEFQWNYQREASKNAVQSIFGVRGVTDNIKIKSEFHHTIEQKDVEKALSINAIDDLEINVSVIGTTVTLSGTVNSWYEKEEAERIVWKTSGIYNVINDLEIDYHFALVS